MNTEIIKISACVAEGGTDMIYGLGKNQKIYYWSYVLGEWVLNEKGKEKVLTSDVSLTD